MGCMDYKGTGKIHSFRGLLANGEQERIRIQGPTGSVAWRIVKFQSITNAPTTVSAEAVMKIYKEEQTSITATIDFGDSALLAVALWTSASSSHTYPEDVSVIFDNEIFNQDIFITHENSNTPYDPCNYYFELEEVKVSKASMAQLAVATARRTID